MLRGVLLLGCGLAATGCVEHAVQVRPIADPAAKYRFAGGLLAEGRAQLALGNAGLALETFRTLQRQQPESADVFAGIAACYAAMGRYDLARTNYEFALAYAPNDRNLLNALASSLDRLGRAEQATQIRAEMRTMTPPAQAPRVAHVTPIGVPRAATLTVKLPPLSAGPPAVSRQPQSRALANVDKPSVAATPQTTLVALPKSVIEPSVALASPSPNERELPRPAPRPEPMEIDKPRQGAFPVSASLLSNAGPRLERASTGEVALITAPVPLGRVPSSPPAERPKPSSGWTKMAQDNQRTTLVASAEARWMPLKYAPAIRLLNAARSQNLAANSRMALLGRGWRKVAIGNASQVRRRTLVMYSPARADVARLLAMHFHCKAVRSSELKGVVVLLGRDAIRPTRATSRA